MLIQDPAIFSLLIPTFNGTPFLTRTLDYLLAGGFKGEVVLSDNSASEPRDFVEACPVKYPGLSIKVFTYPESVSFLNKLTHTLESLPARCVMLHAHDDFFVPDAVEQCVQLLETRLDYAAARGRMPAFRLERNRSQQPLIHLNAHAMRSYEQADAVERVLAHIEHYASTLYSVHRRKNLIESFTYTEGRTKNVIFFQYLSSAITALQGKIHCSDEIFYVRQNHSKSWSYQLAQGDYEHWPMLIASPRLSKYYGEFRDALCALVADRHGVDLNDLGLRLDLAYTRLMHRTVCGVEPIDQEETMFRQRLMNQGSAERGQVNRIVEYCLGYPETY